MQEARLYKNYRPARMPDPADDTIETRVLTALKTLRAVPDPDARFLNQFAGRAISWPETVKEFFEAYGYEGARVGQYRPTHRDVSRMLHDLSWMNGLGAPMFRLIWWRSLDLTFSNIAARIGRSDETARRRYREAIIEVTKEAVRGTYEI